MKTIIAAVLIAAASQWQGKWQSNLTATFSAGTLPNMFTYVGGKGYTKLQGSCTYSGNKAKCNWGERYEAQTYTVEISGHSTMIFVGTAILEHKLYDGARCDDPGVKPCEAAVAKIKGLTKVLRWKRIR
jgi:hypothetical protein